MATFDYTFSVNGFTDTQVEGPLQQWKHTHAFTAVDHHTTHIHEHIEYEHKEGWRGLFSRLLFAKPSLWLLFTARKFLTRRYVGQAIKDGQPQTLDR